MQGGELGGHREVPRDPSCLDNSHQRSKVNNGQRSKVNNGQRSKAADKELR